MAAARSGIRHGSSCVPRANDGSGETGRAVRGDAVRTIASKGRMSRIRTWRAVILPRLPFGLQRLVCPDAAPRRVRVDSHREPQAAPPAAERGVALFEGLDHVLRLAGRLPAGSPGDHVRRSVCELIEANSGLERREKLRVLLEVIDEIEQRRARGPEQSSPTLIEQLLAALRRDVVPVLGDSPGT